MRLPRKFIIKEGNGAMALIWTFLFCALMAREGGDAALAAMMAGANEAVALCLELAGAYLLFLGLLGVAKRAGLMESLSGLLRGATGWLFPGSGAAAGPIALTLSANMLGLGNAATPLGLAAMRELDRGNPRPGVATDNMCAFIAINASAPQLLPTGVLALRQAAGSAVPAAVVLPSLLATCCSTAVAVLLCRLLMRGSRP